MSNLSPAQVVFRDGTDGAAGSFGLGLRLLGGDLARGAFFPDRGLAVRRFLFACLSFGGILFTFGPRGFAFVNDLFFDNGFFDDGRFRPDCR